MSSNYSAKRFEALMEMFIARERMLLGMKSKEYAGDGDRLENFHQQAAFQGVRPEEVALTHLLKHICSITKAVRERRYAWVWKTDSGEGLKQRFTDARNYLILLAACIDEAVEARTDCRYFSPTLPGCILYIREGCAECNRYEKAKSKNT